MEALDLVTHIISWTIGATIGTVVGRWIGDRIFSHKPKIKIEHAGDIDDAHMISTWLTGSARGHLRR